MRTCLMLALMGLVAACAGESGGLSFEPAGPEAAPDPATPGPFPVGVMTIEFTDPERPDEQGNPRRLVTEIWYPAVQAAKDDPTWTYDPVDEADPDFLGEDYQTLVDADLPGLVSLAVRDAELDSTHAPYPLVIFAHSAYGVRWQSVFYTPHLASHGYIVVSCDHAGNTVWNLVRDGFSDGAIALSSYERLADLDLLLDLILQKNDTAGDFLEGAVDHRLIGMAGHSFGGWSAEVKPCEDDRYDVAVAQAPPVGLSTLFGCDLQDYPAPLMIIGATLDTSVTWKDLYCEYRTVIAPEKHLVEITDAGHNTFSDICDLDPDRLVEIFDLGPGNEALSDGCRPENVPWKQAHYNANHYSTAMFNVHLRGSEGSRAFLTENSQSPFVPHHFYSGDAPDWPDGCD